MMSDMVPQFMTLIAHLGQGALIQKSYSKCINISYCKVYTREEWWFWRVCGRKSNLV